MNVWQVRTESGEDKYVSAGMLESVAAWMCQFTPKVSLEPPRALLAEGLRKGWLVAGR